MNAPRFTPNRTPCRRTRREFLWQVGGGFAGLALLDLLSRDGAFAAPPAQRARHPLAERQPHFPAKAKHAVFLFMNGGPSHVDTWQYKPELEKRDGKELEGFDKNTGFFKEQVGPVMKSPFKFARYGESGLWVSDLYPEVATVADDLCVVQSCVADGLTHVAALIQANTGSLLLGRPSLGAWARSRVNDRGVAGG